MNDPEVVRGSIRALSCTGNDDVPRAAGNFGNYVVLVSLTGPVVRNCNLTPAVAISVSIKDFILARLSSLHPLALLTLNDCSDKISDAIPSLNAATKIWTYYRNIEPNVGLNNVPWENYCELNSVLILRKK